ncbi:uroporphyrinogen-III synthase [Virgibacillus natechei]|uniref:Uroporphyrinogen-III synthase n=1 Tax=Virgibacillus natechei TaxID=1216297 RepID=A0ABS4ICZ3_9BACI|nr:uroporphyrinogen-III synthase [Virgibacillus natechei]MBP1968812.1 uroporphyrinogen-III synthase [Virgibacillus natechei]UZD11611.1 uroporphyrinogen-III synthase [Virgibacillus natechei]
MPNSLHGKKILITREARQANEFTEKVLKYGGKPIEVPLLKLTGKNHTDNRRFFQDLTMYEWIFFTSTNGVHYFFQLASEYQIDTGVLKDKKLAVVGHKTGNVLKTYGFTADFIPTTYNATVMASEFLNRYTVDNPILLVRGNRSRDVIPVEFSKHGVAYDSMEVYEITYNYQMTERLNAVSRDYDIDFITFTSPSTVEAFTEMTMVHSGNEVCVCIGTTTEMRARELGFTTIITAEEFTIDGMLTCISEFIAQKGL